MVELLVANEKVAGSNLVSRSKFSIFIFMPDSHRGDSGFFVPVLRLRKRIISSYRLVES